LQAGKARGDEAFTPQANGVSITVQFRGDLLIGGAVVVGGAEDGAAAQEEALWSGARADQDLELLPDFGGQDDA
jgi:hypothetical protein